MEQNPDIQTLEKEVNGNKKTEPKPEFTAAVGISRKWDARDAGREAAENTLKKLNGKKPDFILLFTTIHYEKHGGLQQLLNGAWEIIPEKTPLIGGTVQGFISNEGCFTRGVAALAICNSGIHVSTGIGFNTKRTPFLASKSVLKAINKEVNQSDNTCIIELVSGVTIPDIPFFGRRTIIEESFFGKLALKAFFLTSMVNTGQDKADEIIEYLSRENKTSSIIGACLSDDGKMIRNYQFYGKKVYTNSLICMKLKSKYSFVLETIQALKPTGRKITVTAFSKDRRNMAKINGENAAKEYLRILKTDLKYLGQRDRVARTTFYYPMVYQKGGYYHPVLVGPIINGEIMVGTKIEEDQLEFCRLSVEKLLNNTLETVSALKRIDPPFIYGVLCQTIVETLGNHIYALQNIFETELDSKPFLIILSAGESIYNKVDPHHLYQSFNILSVNAKAM